MNNEFFPVKGYEGLYEVNKMGDVFSLRFSGGGRRMLSKGKDSNGYIMYTLCKNKIQTKIRGHRLVAISLIENLNNYPFVNHKNGIKDDNRVENLEWCTCKMNNDHAKETGLTNIKGSAHGRSKLTEEKVLNIRDIHGKSNITHREIAEMFNCSIPTITLIVNRKTWTHI